jgi:hypothetical protein
MLASSRPTAHRLTRLLSIAAAACVASLAIPATSALAAPGASSSTLASCDGQTFAPVFETLGDSSYYTLVPGGEFNSVSEGWTLLGGARIVQASRPQGATGGVLELPSGSVAISPPTCVTLQYPTARVWLQNVKGNDGVTVAVAYPGTLLTITSPQNVGQVHGQPGSWTLSSPINVQPQIAGAAESTREARFVFTSANRSTTYRLYGLYVDPRMS